ncbi:hypothetical protein V6N00_04395 [Tersicoccus sp. MR15.9]|uniref:hypothetical protein n=1 Tax=Tersicoccus mangrovi TaxID=3121635 RepID=UPI002FE5A5A4
MTSEQHAGRHVSSEAPAPRSARPRGYTSEGGKFVVSMLSSGKTHVVSTEARARMLVNADRIALSAQRHRTA